MEFLKELLTSKLVTPTVFQTRKCKSKLTADLEEVRCTNTYTQLTLQSVLHCMQIKRYLKLAWKKNLSLPFCRMNYVKPSLAMLNMK